MPTKKALRPARTCYDHLAGQLGVAIADRMTQRGHLTLDPTPHLTEPGAAFLHDAGIAGAALLHNAGISLPHSRTRPFCRLCQDWTERRPHIAGTLGAAICRHALAQGWVHHPADTRALAITPAGQAALQRLFDIHP